MNDNLKIAIESSLMAGKAILEIYSSNDFGVEYKSDNSPLTKADKSSHKIISQKLKSTSIPILSEEGEELPFKKRKNWGKLWIIDPIDGTKEFIKRSGEFTVNIALIKNNLPILGVIYAPAIETLYYGDKNGAFKVDNVNFDNFLDRQNYALKLPLSSGNKRKSDSEVTVVASKSHLTEETESFINDLNEEYNSVEIISKGSSLKLCMVAEGLADFYPRFAPTKEWDTAAGQAICWAAGKEVIDWKTKKNMLYNRENILNNWFLVK